IGGMAAVTVLSVVSRRTLPPEARTTLFRDFGRRYLAVAGTALVLTVVCGGILLIARGWDALATAIVIVTAALLASLVLGVRQARAIGRLRQVAAGSDSAETAQRSLTVRGRHALVLRSLIAVLSATLFVLAICTGG